MKKLIAAALLATGALTAQGAAANSVTVEVTNLTNGLWFTPLLFAAHSRNADLFEVGVPASDHLQAMAEGGAIGGLAGDVEAAGGTAVTDPAGGLLPPGMSASADIHMGKRHNRRLSVVAMLLPTNDAFLGLDSVRIPRKPGTYTFYLNGYDAGTEANDELITGGGAPGVPGIPAAPGGDGGSGGTGAAGPDTNGYVHIHRGVLGDTDPAGGISDVDSRVHRWLNPVARVVVTVPHRRYHDDD